MIAGRSKREIERRWIMRIGRGAMMEEKGRVEMNAAGEGRGLQLHMHAKCGNDVMSQTPL